MTERQMDLLPCPFCGGTPAMVEWPCANSPRMIAQVQCECGVNGCPFGADNRLGHLDAENGLHCSAATSAWNRRTPSVLAADPAVKALVAEAEARVWQQVRLRDQRIRELEARDGIILLRYEPYGETP